METSAANTNNPSTPPRKVTSTCTVIDPDGDIILAVPNEDNTKIARFQVSSTALCLASPVFRAMLGSNSYFKEATELALRRAKKLLAENALPTAPKDKKLDQPYEITLQDDSPKALAVLLRILHFKFELVPQTLSQAQVFELAVICDKYDLSKALGLWSRRWSQSVFPNPTELTTSPTPPYQWLALAYVFDRVHVFNMLSQALFLNWKTEPCGEDGIRRRDYIPDFLPSGVITAIEQRREDIASLMLCKARELLDWYSMSSEVRCDNKEESCDALVLGHLIKAFTKIKILSHRNILLPRQVTQAMSIRTLKQALVAIEFPKNVSNRFGDEYMDPFIDDPRPKHSSRCSPLPGFRLGIERVYRQVRGFDLKRFKDGVQESDSEVTVYGGKKRKLWDCIDG